MTQFQAVLNETSYGLHRLTQRQGLIKEFDIILPKSWHVPSCEPGRQMTSVQRANPARPDIFVDAKAADNRGQTEIGPRPWTEQPQGCGQPGFAIHMPSSFLNLQDKAPFYKDSWELRTKGKLQFKTQNIFTPIQMACTNFSTYVSKSVLTPTTVLKWRISSLFLHYSDS